MNLWRFTSHLASFPIVSILLLAASFMGYYNLRGTHDIFLFPYSVNDRVYGNAPHFIWQQALPPRHSENPQLEAMFTWERQYWEDNRLDGVRHLVKHASLVAIKITYFFLWPQFLLPLAVGVLCVRDNKVRFFLPQFFFCLLGMVVVVWSQPHYAAPLTVTIFLLIIQGIRHIRQWRFCGRPVGIGLSRVIASFAALMVLVYIAEAAVDPTLASFVAPAGVWANPGNQSRAKVLGQLEALPGKHLVIVRYSTGYGETGEWVYNRADIDNAKVVWAREIPGVDMKRLLNYFSSYHIWLLEPRFSPPRLTQF